MAFRWRNDRPLAALRSVLSFATTPQSPPPIWVTTVRNRPKMQWVMAPNLIDASLPSQTCHW